MARALVVVDVQNDFCEGGTLPVHGGHKVAMDIMEYVNTVQQSEHPSFGWGHYNVVYASLDWHIDPGSHWARPGTEPDFVDSWPVHCEAGTWGANLHPAIEALGSWVDERLYKGLYSAAYSAMEALRPPDLTGFDIVDVVGLAADYCVYQTALDISKLTYDYGDVEQHEVRIITDLTAPISPEKMDSQRNDTPSIKYITKEEASRK